MSPFVRSGSNFPLDLGLEVNVRGGFSARVRSRPAWPQGEPLEFAATESPKPEPTLPISSLRGALLCIRTGVTEPDPEPDGTSVKGVIKGVKSGQLKWSDPVSGFGLKDKRTRSPWKPFTGSEPVHRIWPRPRLPTGQGFRSGNLGPVTSPPISTSVYHPGIYKPPTRIADRSQTIHNYSAPSHTLPRSTGAPGSRGITKQYVETWSTRGDVTPLPTSKSRRIIAMSTIKTAFFRNFIC
jgi:hypothetical protein